MAASGELKYEDALKRLEKLVDELDRPELDLEARLKKFEEGTKLTRALLKKLEQAKKRVDVLVKSRGGDVTLEPFETHADDERAEGADTEA